MCQAAAPVCRMHAQLRDVSALRANSGCKYEGDHFPACTIDNNMRHGRDKGSAACVANDVIQEARGAMHRAILIVDLAVGMHAIGIADEPRCRSEVVIAPRSQFESAGQGCFRSRPQVIQLTHHEQTAEDLKAGTSEKV